MSPSRPDASADFVPLTTCDTHDEAALIRYGLKLRQIPSDLNVPRSSLLPTRAPRPIGVRVPRESLKRAKGAIQYIAGAVHGDGVAITPDLRCAICGYDMTGLGSQTLCPDCGTALPSHRANKMAKRRLPPDA